MAIRRPQDRKRIAKPPSLLIIHLDAATLRADGLMLSEVTKFAGVVSSLSAGADVVVKETTTLRHLLDELGQLARDGCCFDVIVAVGHSNHRGIQIASDKFAAWHEFAGYLRPFAPRRLMLVACQAGRWPAARVLFTKLPKLRRIFASPVNASKDLGTLMIAMAPYLVEVKAPPTDLVLKAQGWLMALTGGQVRHWMRKDKDRPQGLVLDRLSKKADPIVRELHGVLRRLFP